MLWVRWHKAAVKLEDLVPWELLLPCKWNLYSLRMLSTSCTGQSSCKVPLRISVINTLRQKLGLDLLLLFPFPGVVYKISLALCWIRYLSAFIVKDGAPVTLLLVIFHGGSGMKWNMDGYGCWSQSSPDSSSNATNYPAFTPVQSMEMPILSFPNLSVELAPVLAGLGLWFAACHSADHRQAVKSIEMLIQASRASQLQFSLAKSPSCIPFPFLFQCSHTHVWGHILEMSADLLFGILKLCQFCLQSAFPCPHAPITLSWRQTKPEQMFFISPGLD